jgi:hypothetical protein
MASTHTHTHTHTQSWYWYKCHLIHMVHIYLIQCQWYWVILHVLAFNLFATRTYDLEAHGDTIGWGSATTRKGVRSIPDYVTGIFHWHNPSGRTMTLGVDSASNTIKHQEYFLGVKSGRCVGLTTLQPLRADCLEIWDPQFPGTLRACPGLYRNAQKSLARSGRKKANLSVRMAWIFLRRLALQGGKKLDDSTRHDAVEIARVPVMLPSFFPSRSGKGLISTPVQGLFTFTYHLKILKDILTFRLLMSTIVDVPHR